MLALPRVECEDNGSMERPATRSVIILTAALLASGAILLYALPSTSFDVGIAVQPSRFSLGTAILVAGYVLLPILAILAAGLLLISAMLLAGAAIERRRIASTRPPSISKDR